MFELLKNQIKKLDDLCMQLACQLQKCPLVMEFCELGHVNASTTDTTVVLREVFGGHPTKMS
jgi:hypothetical protein